MSCTGLPVSGARNLDAARSVVMTAQRTKRPGLEFAEQSKTPGGAEFHREKLRAKRETGARGALPK